uniref:Uncharacterized protein n=1 Tax=Tetradesmus obliquus TaxID=3088 RepID=A0A383W758_TETOB|eukprot:jgi/Sobl393_1/20010/SZX71400.1
MQQQQQLQGCSSGRKPLQQHAVPDAASQPTLGILQHQPSSAAAAIAAAHRSSQRGQHRQAQVLVCISSDAESVARTMLGRQQSLEFQDPPVGADARGRVLANTSSMKQRDAALAAACSARLQANRQATSRWASMYSREFLQQEFVLRVEQQQQQRQ